MKVINKHSSTSGPNPRGGLENSLRFLQGPQTDTISKCFISKRIILLSFKTPTGVRDPSTSLCT